MTRIKNRPKGRLFLAATMILFCLSPTQAAAETLEFGGSLSSSFGVFLLSCDWDCRYLDYENRNVLDLEMDADLGMSAAARAAVSLHGNFRTDISRVEDSADVANLQDLSLRITDVWVEGYDIGVDGLDVRVGAQAVRWGTGDGFSPSDRLSPYDFSDPTQFDRRLATPAVHANYYLSAFTISATWFPFFIPSLLNERVVDLAAGPDAADNIDLEEELDGQTLEVNRIRTRVEVPPPTLSESSFAIQGAWAGAAADIAVGWFYGRDSLPALSGEVIPENFFDGETTDLVVNLRYPRMQMLAAEVRAPLFDSWTGWIDAALVIPSRTTVFISESRLRDLERLNVIDEAPDGDISAVIQTGRPYLNFLAGADRSIGTNLYLNIQYLHGFLFERNAEDQHHYGIVGLRAPAMDAPFQVDVRAGVEANRGFNAFGFLSQLGVTYLHADVLELSAGGVFQWGQEGTTLRQFTPLSEVRVGAGAHF